jgi:hypothetical protein
VLENEESRPLSQELANLTHYEDFLRRRLPGVVRSALETPENNEIQPLEERLIRRLTDIVEQAQNRLSHEYRDMMGTMDNVEASVHPNHVSNQSRLTSSQDSNGKRPERDVTTENSLLSHDSRLGLMASGAASYQFARTDLNTNFESMPTIQQGLENAYPSELYAQIQDTLPDEGVLSEEVYSDNQALFSSQPWGTASAPTDSVDFMWELLLREDSAGDINIT